MVETGLKAGDIFTWENYPLSMDKLKSRWFLYCRFFVLLTQSDLRVDLTNNYGIIIVYI